MERIVFLQIPSEEKYKLMLSCFWMFSTTLAFEFAQNFGLEKTFEFFPKGTNAMAHKMGEKLKKKFDLKENIEDSLKLLLLYYREIWGSEDGYAKKTDDNKGVFIVPSCSWYDKFFSFAKVPCNKSCEMECNSLLKPLSSKIKMEVIKAKSLGDNICEFQVIHQ